MISTASIVLQSIVNFNFLAATQAILGTGYEGAKVMAILDAETANNYINTATLHANLYPMLPAGTPNDPTAYPYLKLKLASGQTTVVGLPWIDDSSWVVQQRAKMTIVTDALTPDDQNKVKLALNSAGFSNFTITLSSPT